MSGAELTMGGRQETTYAQSRSDRG